MVRFVFILLAIFNLASPLTAQSPQLKLLFLGDNGSHKPAKRFAIFEPILRSKGIELRYSDDVTVLSERSLSDFDGLVLYANIDSIAPEQASALLKYVESGRGFIPIHCATFCFRNAPEIVALMGAQFQKHGTGEMETQSAGVSHPVVDGYNSFTSWDETYVHHLHNESDRTVLEYRVGEPQAAGKSREPWTWVRTQGQGRVFYTAWGHDERTWNQPGFHELIERGIRWACDVEIPATIAREDFASAPAAVKMPAMKRLPKDPAAFNYVDVGPEIPNYTAGAKWGEQAKPMTMMQQPAPATESMKHMVTPEGFHIELFADESLLNGKPISMNWDDAGRLWVCETVDYPNELQDDNRGHDRVRILTDGNGDGVADQSVVFAESLSIPTTIAFHRGGVIVQNGTETLYMKDLDGDGKSDVRQILMSNWTLGDTHGGVSNFRNGLDNWIWAMQGYNDSAVLIDGVKQPSFRMGFFRFKLSQEDHPKVEQLEFLRSTNNNTWGLGISEEGLIFGSTANRAPSCFMPIANRYYERVKGWAPDRLEMISKDHLFKPITDKIRQVDHHGGYTAGAGHALYTARNYPDFWWNRTAFVCGPTGKLVGTFVIEPDGAGMKSDSPLNLLASDDEWTAPIMAEVGPDGNVWVIDWYNYIVQHNPTPQGFETGKGKAYETKLRDKKYGRIYRVVPDSPNTDTKPASSLRSLANGDDAANVSAWIDALSSPTMQVRLSAQRRLVERGNPDISDRLIELIGDQKVDQIGLNVSAIHAINTLDGLGLVTANHPPVISAVTAALRHPSAGVRLNAIRVLPDDMASFAAMNAASLLDGDNAQVELAFWLKLADVRSSTDAEMSKQESMIGTLISDQLRRPKLLADRWLVDAITSAAAMHVDSFLVATLKSSDEMPAAGQAVVARVAEHLARSRPTQRSIASLIDAMSKSANNSSESVIAGLSNGWPADHEIVLDAGSDTAIRSVFTSSSRSSQATLARLAALWSNSSLEQEIKPIIAAFGKTIRNRELDVNLRVDAANQLIELSPQNEAVTDLIAEQIGPQSPVTLSIGLARALSRSKVAGIDETFIDLAMAATPELRSAIVRELMLRTDLTLSLLSAIQTGRLQLSDLTIEQRDNLRSHPSKDIRDTLEVLMTSQGIKVNNDRAMLVNAKLDLTKRMGDSELGRAIFAKSCATCHVFKGEGNIVGPNLNGMSVHPKAELLTHILDPNRSVEANYRLYSVMTDDGTIVSGLLSSESLTTIEIIDTQGKRHKILREEIDELRPSTKSAMPEGFEQTIDDIGLVNLLEYMTQAEPYIALGLESVANVSTTQGMFSERSNLRECLELPAYGLQTIDGVPFQLIDPRDSSVKNALMLHGPLGAFPRDMPKKVDVRCRLAAKSIHILGGVAGWGAMKPGNEGVSVIVRLQYADGQSEDHPLVSGQHIADYIGLFEVPESKLALRASSGGQVRTLSINPARDAVIDTIELIKPDHVTAPLFFAITAEPIATAH